MRNGDEESIQTTTRESLLRTLSEIESLYSQEREVFEIVPLGYLGEMRYYLWMSYLYGELALTDPAYLEKSQNYAQGMYALYESKKTIEGQNALIGARIPDVLINDARYTYMVLGARGRPHVVDALDRLMQEVKAHPSWHEGGFIALIKNMTSTAVSGNKSASYKHYVALANEYPPFKAFLNEYGWNLK